MHELVPGQMVAIKVLRHIWEGNDVKQALEQAISKRNPVLRTMAPFVYFLSQCLLLNGAHRARRFIATPVRFCDAPAPAYEMVKPASSSAELPNELLLKR